MVSSAGLFFCNLPILWSTDNLIKLRDLYNKDLSFSSLAQNLNGKEVRVYGFMAPPLKAEANFFVLTKMPMSVCPFCESEADWPDDLILVYTRDIIDALPFNVPIVTKGTLDIGTKTDPETGFVSKVRLLQSEFKKYYE